MPKNAQAQVYVTQLPLVPRSFIGIVSEYDASTGSLINPKFITELNNPFGLALKGTTLFVANTGTTSSKHVGWQIRRLHRRRD